MRAGVGRITTTAHQLCEGVPNNLVRTRGGDWGVKYEYEACVECITAEHVPFSNFFIEKYW